MCFFGPKRALQKKLTAPTPTKSYKVVAKSALRKIISTFKKFKTHMLRIFHQNLIFWQKIHFLSPKMAIFEKVLELNPP